MASDLQKVLAKQQLQMTLLKQAVEVRETQDVSGKSPDDLTSDQFHHEADVDSFFSAQMYVHHGIHDLIFNFVGTLEASQVGVICPATLTLSVIHFLSVLRLTATSVCFV